MLDLSPIAMFKKLSIECHYGCNRKCFDCLRQTSGKDDTNVTPEESRLPIELVDKILQGAAELGFGGSVALHHHSEPLMDPERLVKITKWVRSYKMQPYLCTNGDYLTPELAGQLDGILAEIFIATYDVSELADVNSRFNRLKRLFKKTRVDWASERLITHFSPRGHKDMLRQHREERCLLPQQRLIILHNGRMSLCCEDLNAEYNLGSIKNYTVKELWWSTRHQYVVKTLRRAGSRKEFAWCANCPIGTKTASRAVTRGTREA